MLKRQKKHPDQHMWADLIARMGNLFTQITTNAKRDAKTKTLENYPKTNKSTKIC